MSPIAKHSLSLINRNLQAVALAGAVLFALTTRSAGVQRLYVDLPLIDVLRLIVLFGLPAMLLIFGKPSRPLMNRILARATATFLAAAVAVDAVFFQSPVMPLLLSCAGVVLLQVAIMRALEERRARKAS